jgi:predicted dehydrogenase
MLEQGEFGDLLLAVNVTGHNGGLFKDPSNWRAMRKHAPGGPLMQLTVHSFDNWQFWFGPIKSIQAAGGHAVTPGDNDDHFAGQARFASGLLGSFATQYASPGGGFDAVYGTRRTLFKDSGGITDHLCNPVQNPTFNPGTERQPIDLRGSHSGIRPDVEDFARDIQAGRQPHASGEDGLRAVACVHAALISSQQDGEWVNIDALLDEA